MDERKVDRRLRRQRPRPHPQFRGSLQRRLGASLGGPGARLTPRQRLALAVVTGAAGAALLVVAGLGVTGAGPLAP